MKPALIVRRGSLDETSLIEASFKTQGIPYELCNVWQSNWPSEVGPWSGFVILCGSVSVRLGSRVWAFQFHPELTETSLRAWVAAGLEGKEVDVISAGRILDWVSQYLEPSQALGARVFSRFAEVVKDAFIGP